MVINFRTCEISRGAHKLIRTLTLIKKHDSGRYEEGKIHYIVMFFK